MKKKIIEIQYKTAIDARDKLNENYHKWMTFYYVANGAILVAITTLFSEVEFNKGIFFLSLLGVLICMLWNLSCKGYYYWSNSWIDLIIGIEKKLFGKKKLVYGAFSKDIANNEKPSWFPLQPNNISTPKLTLIFSFISFLSWTIYSIYSFNQSFIDKPIEFRIISAVVIVILILLLYMTLPKHVKSRKNDKHKLK